MEDYKENLKTYVREDIVYQDYKKKPLKKFNDFEEFCIQHCQDIEKILEENKMLKQEITNLRKGKI